jgi:hypothetical protein
MVEFHAVARIITERLQSIAHRTIAHTVGDDVYAFRSAVLRE